MTSKRTILLTFCIVAILVLGSLTGTILYYYRHPSAIKALIERSLSTSTGTSFKVEGLAYSINPLSLEAKGITVEPGKGQHGFCLEIPNLKADMLLAGPFGHKSLSFANLKIEGLSGRLSREVVLPGMSPKKDVSPSLLARVLKRMISLFLFREVTIEAAELVNGEVTFQSRDQIIAVSQIHARFSPKHHIDVSCTAHAEWPQENVHLVVSHAHLATDHAISFVNPQIKGLLRVQGATFESRQADIRGMELESTLIYDHNHKKLVFDPVDLRFGAITLGQKTEGEPIRLTGRATGNLRAEGSFPDVDLSVCLKGDHITVSGKGMALKPLKAKVSLSGKHPVYQIEEIHVDLPQATLAIGNRDVQVEDIRVHAQKGSLNADDGWVSSPEVLLTSSLLKNLRLSVGVNEKEAVVELRGEDIGLVESALTLGLVPSGWQFSGLDSLQVRAVLKDNDRWSLTSRVGFTDFAFQDKDGAYMGEGIVLEAGSEAEIDLQRSNVTADTTLKIDGGEVLWDSFYLNLAKNPFSALLKGKYGFRQKSLQLSKTTLGLKDILRFDLHGTFVHEAANPIVDLFANIDELPLNPIYRHFVSEPFRAQKPFLASMHTEGSIAADIRLTATQTDWVARGNFAWRDGALSFGDKPFSLRGIQLELPVWHETQKDVVAEETATGRLSIQSISLPVLAQRSVSLPLDVGPNRLVVRSPTSLRIPGGTVKVGPVVCQDILGEKPSIETSLEAKDIEINALLSGIWASPIKGTINGKLDPIRFEGDTVTSRGEISANAFHGQVILSNIGVSGLSTSGPVFKLDAEGKDLNLAELTTGTSFGRVEGILQGYVKGLEIAYGQPQAFDLLMETVETKGVSQKISVKAVDNIAQIGGGRSPFMGLAGSFASFFKEFPYQKIGVRASLENDVFRINGTIREGGTEYLVKRGSFSGVNVVNQNPDNRVRFKDMVKRIRRVTDSKTGPVVK